MAKNEVITAVNVDTGECGEYIINKTVKSEHFYKIFMADFLMSLDILNVKSVDILAYVMQNMRQSDNTLIATQEEIAKGAGTSARTVMRVFTKLQEIDFIRKKTNGVYIVNPKFIIKGNDNKKRMIINYYNELECYKKNDETTEPDESED